MATPQQTGSMMRESRYYNGASWWRPSIGRTCNIRSSITSYKDEQSQIVYVCAESEEGKYILLLLFMVHHELSTKSRSLSLSLPRLFRKYILCLYNAKDKSNTISVIRIGWVQPFEVSLGYTYIQFTVD